MMRDIIDNDLWTININISGELCNLPTWIYKRLEETEVRTSKKQRIVTSYGPNFIT
jgi:hypothetical protein